MTPEEQEMMYHNLASFCEDADRYSRKVAIVTGAGGVSRAVARALVQDRGYAVLLVSRGKENLNKAYEHVLASGIGFSSQVARYGKVVGGQQIDLADQAQVDSFVFELTRAATTAGVSVKLIVYAAGAFAWDDEPGAATMLAANYQTKFRLFGATVHVDGHSVWGACKHAFIGSVAAGFVTSQPDFLGVHFPDGRIRKQYWYAFSQESVRGFSGYAGLSIDTRFLLLEPGGMEDTETMVQFPQAIRDQIKGQTVRTEVVQPLFDWLDGTQVAAPAGKAFSTTP